MQVWEYMSLAVTYQYVNGGVTLNQTTLYLVIAFIFPHFSQPGEVALLTNLRYLYFFN